MPLSTDPFVEFDVPTAIGERGSDDELKLEFKVLRSLSPAG